MSSSHAGRILRRVIPPSRLDEESQLESFWLFAPKDVESPPALLWTDPLGEMDEVVQAHETPMGACLLSPQSVAGWGIWRKVKHIGETPSSSSSDMKAESAGEQQTGMRRSNELQQESRVRGSKVDRWSKERYKAAELKLVEIMHDLGAGLPSPIARQELREEVRKHVGDTGLLDHLLKHMVGKVVADGAERLRRRYNSEGTMEYWLEPADLAVIRQKAGVTDPNWIPPPGWKLGDATSLCKEAVNRLREEVAALKRDYQSLLQWKRKVEEEMEDEVVEGHETLQGACLLSPISAGLAGWGIRRKVKYTRRHRKMPPLSDEKAESAGEQWIGKKRSWERMKKKKGDKRDQKKPGNDREVSKVDRWSSERYEVAELKLVEIMHDLGAELGSPIMRQTLRDKMRRHIGDTGLLDHLLKHMVGKVVADGTERLRRRHNTEGAMEYWLEPANLVEIRRKAGVLDPFWVPPPGWKLGDATSPCPCGTECKKEMSWIREEVAALKREVGRLSALVQLEKQAKEARSEAGGLLELVEMEEQGGRRDGCYVQLLTGTEEEIGECRKRCGG